jgi:hypothetical protein
MTGFRRGDEAYSHRARLPDGHSDCASRFRLDPTHSLLVRLRLGRNLITLFSTVNTPREKKFGSVRATGALECSRAHREDATNARDAPLRRAIRKTKIAFFQRFHSQTWSPTRCVRMLRRTRVSARARRLRLRESMRYETLRRGRISAPHKPDCANLRELRSPIRRSQRRRRGVVTCRNRHSRVDIATRETAHAHLETRTPPTAFAACTRANGSRRSRRIGKKTLRPFPGAAWVAQMRQSKPGGASTRLRRWRRLSARRLRAVRRSRRG